MPTSSAGRLAARINSLTVAIAAAALVASLRLWRDVQNHGAFTTVAFVPQVLRTWRIKSASDLSLAMISLNSTGIFLWLVYGLYTRSLPIIVANLVTFLLMCAVLIVAIKYR